MEELIYKLEILVKLKEAISSTYSEVAHSDTYHECMELVNDVESEVVKQMKNIEKK